MILRKYCLILAFLLMLQICLTNSSKANDFDKNIPTKVITLPFILKNALQGSNRLLIIKSEMITKDNPSLYAKDPLDFRINSAISNTNSRLDNGESAFSPDSMDSQKFTTTMSKTYKYGTSIQAELSHERRDLSYPSLAPSPSTTLDDSISEETKIQLSLKQSLWKNSFGYSTQKKLEASDIQAKATKLKVEDNINNWVTDIANLYYNIYLVWQEIDTARERVSIQDRLAYITKLLYKRGTAEEADLFQVKASLEQAKQQLIDKKKKD